MRTRASINNDLCGIVYRNMQYANEFSIIFFYLRIIRDKNTKPVIEF